MVPGIPVGFKTTTKRAKFSKDYAKYIAYKKLVQIHARMAGIKLPLKAVKDRPLMIRTVSYFKNGVHPDPGNVQKGVCDALFYKVNRQTGTIGKGDDKYTGGSFPPPRYDKGNPRVIVIIKDYEHKEEVKSDEARTQKSKRRNRRRD